MRVDLQRKGRIARGVQMGEDERVHLRGCGHTLGQQRILRTVRARVPPMVHAYARAPATSSCVCGEVGHAPQWAANAVVGVGLDVALGDRWQMVCAVGEALQRIVCHYSAEKRGATSPNSRATSPNSQRRRW